MNNNNKKESWELIKLWGVLPGMNNKKTLSTIPVNSMRAIWNHHVNKKEQAKNI